jgi:hypothetical protein
MFASVFLLGLASFVLIRALSRSRGFYRYADAVFPLLFLNWGHYENLLWGWQLTQVLPIAVAAMLLAAIVRWKLDPPFRVAVLASFSLVTLPLSGGVGLPCTLGFALWLVAAGHRAWLRGTAKLKIHALIIWSISGLALILAAAYFRNLTNIRMPPVSAIHAAARAFVLVPLGFGPAGESVRPWSTVLVLALGAGATLSLALAVRHPEPGRRSAAWAYGCAFVAFAGLAMSVGIGRAGYVPRYFLFGVPAICWIYCLTELAAAPVLRRTGRGAILALSAAAIVFNTPAGLSYARARRNTMDAFAMDMRARMPPSRLIARHQRELIPFPGNGAAYRHEGLGARFEILRRFEIGAFRMLAPEPAHHEIDLRHVARQPRVDDRMSRPGWTWTLATPQYLEGIRILRPSQPISGGASAGVWTLRWLPNAAAPFVNYHSYVHWWTPAEIGATVWIYDSVATIRLEPPEGGLAMDTPELRLVVPDSGSAAVTR